MLVAVPVFAGVPERMTELSAAQQYAIPPEDQHH
jgi:hypothetical protein